MAVNYINIVLIYIKKREDTIIMLVKKKNTFLQVISVLTQKRPTTLTTYCV